MRQITTLRTHRWRWVVIAKLAFILWSGSCWYRMPLSIQESRTVVTWWRARSGNRTIGVGASCWLCTSMPLADRAESWELLWLASRLTFNVKGLLVCFKDTPAEIPRYLTVTYCRTKIPHLTLSPILWLWFASCSINSTPLRFAGIPKARTLLLTNQIDWWISQPY